MQRLFRVFSVSLLALTLLACAGLPQTSNARSFTVPESRLVEAVAKRFPYQQRVAEVLELKVLAPRLTLMPTTNRIGTQLDLDVLDRLTGTRYPGAMAMDYGLRFDNSDNSIRMSGVRVTSVSLAGLPEPYQAVLARYAPRLAERLLDGLALHRFTEQDLSLVSGLGLEPGDIKVTEKGLSVTLQPKGSRP